MVAYLIKFLILLSPFALFTYLHSIMEELSHRDFLRVIFKASFTSCIIFIISASYGSEILEHLLSIKFESFEIFGGIVLVAFSLVFLIQGKQSFFTLKGGLDKLAADIALPFMVGAATVSLSIIIGNTFTELKAVLIIVSAMVLNYGVLVALLFLKYNFLRKKFRVAFDKLLGVLTRLNGFIIGAIGVDMVYRAIVNIS